MSNSLPSGSCMAIPWWSSPSSLSTRTYEAPSPARRSASASTRRRLVSIPQREQTLLTTRTLDRVGVTGCLVGAAAGQPPGHEAGLVLGQAPARRLLGLVMP